jgi:hypothetical protein
MKRLRPERPSGKPKKKERRRCLKCDRFMTRAERGWKRYHQKTWFCNKCWMWYGYYDGVLLGISGKASDWWESKGKWRMIPDGLLIVYEGTPEE